MAAYDDLNVKSIFVVGIISVVVTAVTALAVQVLYYAMAQQQQAETSAASNYKRQLSILKEQQDEISTYGVDELTGNIVIPVEKVIEELSSETTAEANTTDQPTPEATSNSDSGDEA
ncbi:hypothetical protein OAE79_00455 [Rhodopirellula sp.]|nr:hypothetical protein [Rhodopirellula sp.]MDB4678781.1 hypothetical protein [Rhodopirellula sp.]